MYICLMYITQLSLPERPACLQLGMRLICAWEPEGPVQRSSLSVTAVSDRTMDQGRGPGQNVLFQ